MIEREEIIMKEWAQREKERKRLHIYVMLIAMLTISIFAIRWGMKSEAANLSDIYVTTGGDPFTHVVDGGSVTITNDETLTLNGTENSDVIKWELTDLNQKIVSLENATSKSCNIKISGTGKTPIKATITRGSETKEITCYVEVKWGIDTSNQKVFYRVKDSDKEKVAVLSKDDSSSKYPSSTKISIGLKNANDLTWTSENENVVCIGSTSGTGTQVTGSEAVLNAVGAGKTTIKVDDGTNTATLDVYVLPKIKGIDGQSATNDSYTVDTGAIMETNAHFTSEAEGIKARMQWAIYQYDENRGDYTLLKTSFDEDKASDLIQLKSVSEESRDKLKLIGKAGSYNIKFYPNGLYTEEEIKASKTGTDIGNIKAVTVSVKINSNLGDRNVNLNKGDKLNLAEALNVSLKDLTTKYKVSTYLKNDTSKEVTTPYIKYDRTNQVIEALQETENNFIWINVVEISSQKTVASFDVRIVDNLLLNMSNISLPVGGEMQLFVVTGSYDGELTWKSSDEKYVTVDQNGLIKGIAKTDKDVTITVTQQMSDGSVKVATCKVKVDETIQNLKLSETETKIVEGGTKTITASFTPDRNEAPLKWMSSDTSVFTINVSSDNKSVVVTGVKAGTAILTALNQDNYVAAVCKIDVVSEIESLTLPTDNMTVSLKQEYVRLVAECKPETAANNTLIWKSENPALATVDNEGLVTLKAPGRVRIYVSPSYDPTHSIYAECWLTIKQEAESIALNSHELTVDVGETKGLGYSLAPEGSTTNVTWSSLDETIATINAKGEVTGCKAGKTYIIATTSEGKSDICSVSVTQAATNIEFLEQEITIANGSTYVIPYVLTPEDATSPISWKSMNPEIVSVGENGVITAHKVGETYVMATIADGYSATCKITVTEKSTGITLSKSEIVLENGHSEKIGYVLAPEGATTVLTWKSLDSSIATVDNTGTVVGKKAGSTYIVVTSEDGYSETCKVTVTQQASGISLEMTELTLGVGDSYTVGVTFTPEDSTERLINWSSQNSKIASVNSDGTITGVSVGNTVIFARIASGEMAQIMVAVNNKLGNMTLDKSKKTITVGATFTLKPIFTPSNASNKKVTWSSSNKSVATVSTSGKVKGIKGGTSMITCVSKDGGYTASCFVSVVEKVTSVKLNHTSYKLTVGKNIQLKATVSSNGATNKIVKWTSSNKKVATVNSRGKVTAKKLGTCTIKAKATDGSGEYATCKIRVIRRATRLSISQSYIKLYEGNSRLLKAKVRPSNASNKRVKWSSSNSSIAVVSSKGKVTGVAEGTAKISVKTTDGSNIKATCVVKVEKRVPVTSMTVSASDIVMVKGTSQNASVVISPSDTTDRIRYASDNRSVATVTSKGRIKAIRPGTATIIVSASSGQETSINVTVVGLNKTSITMQQYDSDDLWVEEISDTVKWTSSDPAIARVINGKVVGRKVGRCTITATVRGVKLYCSVRITKIK